MQKRSMDGLGKLHTRIAVRVVKPKTVIPAATHGPRVAYYTISPAPVLQQKTRTPFRAPRQLKIFSIYASIVLVISSFALGVWVTWSTRNSLADTDVPQVARAAIPLDSSVGLGGGNLGQLPTQAMLSMTMEQLESVLQAQANPPEKQEADRLAKRAAQLKTYLESKSSPLAAHAETIAKLKHWRLVLAISNSESSLGKRCANNNCSGIGVMPGHPLWRTYPSKAEWAQDLDKLIERRYKDWSLEDMNGVYNQPGSDNWVFAAKQILDDLKSVE